MKITGILKLHYNTDDYIMFCKGRLVNISEYLNCMLLDDVYVCIKDGYTNDVLFENEGRLVKEKVQPCYYLYHINGQNFDSILWDNVGKKLSIEIVNVSKYT